MKKIYPRFAALALAAAFAVSGGTLAATGAPAFAADLVVTGQPSARVAYADLDLSRAAGRERLEARIRSAAERLCSEPGTQTLQDRLASDACRAEVIASAEPQLRRALGSVRLAAAAPLILHPGR